MFAHGGTAPYDSRLAGRRTAARRPGHRHLALRLVVVPLRCARHLSQARGPSSTTTRADRSTYFCAYDSSGNLYVNGWRSGSFSSAARAVAGVTELNLKTSSPAGVQWDGTYVAMATKAPARLPCDYERQDKGNRGAQARHQRKRLARRLDTHWPELLRRGPVGLWKYPSAFTDQNDQLPTSPPVSGCGTP